MWYTFKAFTTPWPTVAPVPTVIVWPEPTIISPDNVPLSPWFTPKISSVYCKCLSTKPLADVRVAIPETLNFCDVVPPIISNFSFDMEVPIPTLPFCCV